MLTLIIQIIMTGVAWKKGWGPKALLPMVIGLGLAFIIGFTAGLSGGSPRDIAAPLVLVDLGMLISLIVMVSRKPAKSETSKEIGRPTAQGAEVPAPSAK
jgi:hypothetical protein